MATPKDYNKGKKTRALGYLRVSTGAQAEPEKYGLDAQKAAILKYAEAHNIEITEWRTDIGSGVDPERKELNEILYGNCFNPPVEAVIVFKSDRVARDTKLYFYCLFLLERKGIKLLSVEEDFPEGSEFANIFRSMMMFAAEMERKNIATRTGKGRIQKSLGGGYAGGRPPYGYKTSNHQLVIDEDEAPIVQYIFRRHDEGGRDYHIACELNEMGKRTRNGKFFANTHIMYIIKNRPIYEGYYKYGPDAKWIKGIHEPLIPISMEDPNESAIPERVSNN